MTSRTDYSILNDDPFVKGAAIMDRMDGTMAQNPIYRTLRDYNSRHMPHNPEAYQATAHLIGTMVNSLSNEEYRRLVEWNPPMAMYAACATKADPNSTRIPVQPENPSPKNRGLKGLVATVAAKIGM